MWMFRLRVICTHDAEGGPQELEVAQQRRCWVVVTVKEGELFTQHQEDRVQ